MVRRVVIMGLLALGVASAASAATHHAKHSRTTVRHSTARSSGGLIPTTIGPRLGFSVSPDQVVVGGQLQTGFAPNWTLNPGFEIGFGDNETVTVLNFDGEYHFKLQGSTWAPYAGLGMGVNFIHTDVPSPLPDVNNTATGLNLILGTTIPTVGKQNMFTEFRVGAGDSAIPEFKGIIGWNFRI